MMYCKLLLVILLLQITQTDAQGSTHRNFLQWKQQHGKTYADQTEQLYRFYVYSKNVQTIKQVNSQPDLTYKLAVNRFVDLTSEELNLIYLTAILPPHDDDQDSPKEVQTGNLRQDGDNGEDENPFIGASYPSNASCVFQYDFSIKNASLKMNFPLLIQDQGQCGSCYAFATMASIDGAAAIKYNISYVGSPQEIVDCSSSYGNLGCGGGSMSYVYNYAKITNVSTNASYPYKGISGSCKNASIARGPVRVSTYSTAYVSSTNLTGNCAAMLTKLKTTPMTVAVAVPVANNNQDFFFYSSGVFPLTSCPAGSINHAVYLIGFDTCNNWKIQNSWGKYWGESGFMRLAPGNTCNICRYGGYYPTLL